MKTQTFRVLLMGDSIRGGYEPHVKRILAKDGRFDVVGVNSNCEHSTNTLKIAHWWFYLQPKPAVIHINCGLHDIKTISYRDRENLVPIEFYRRNLTCIIGLARRLRGTRIILATTTPIHQRDANRAHRKWMDFRRFEADVHVYNDAMRSVAASEGVILNDLHAAAIDAGVDGMLSRDGVHFTAAGYKALADIVAENIRKALRL
jgi:lysophospholipase L1-like esterase